jgi:hypothetical protein
MPEINREATPIEKVAFAIQALTYGDLMEAASSIRDILGDRVSDGEELSNSRTIADVLHSWAEAELFTAESPSDV